MHHHYYAPYQVHQQQGCWACFHSRERERERERDATQGVIHMQNALTEELMTLTEKPVSQYPCRC